jgi:hypothetical protein
MNAIVKRIELPGHSRLIAISDIHGNLPLLQKLLQKVDYSREDILLILGDIIEKGPWSLETLRYIMSLSEENRVYTVSGNCDAIWSYIRHDIDDQGLLRYMVLRKNTLLNEMCRALGIGVEAHSDIKDIKRKINQFFDKELRWLEQLPHIIETQHFIFAHAGISGENLERQDADWVMKNDAFMRSGICFSKYVMVGHWPVINYSTTKGDCNPIINREQRIISIDGGNIIKKDGQLNAVIVKDNDPEQISCTYVDDLPTGKVIEGQGENRDTLQITWIDNAVQLLEPGEEFSLCRHMATGHELRIFNSYLHHSGGAYYCQDCTDYFLPLAEGDEIGIIEVTTTRTLAKKDGLIGWVSNEKLAKE